MAKNVLLPLGSGTPSASRREDAVIAAPRPKPAKPHSDHFVVRNGVQCAGVHLIVDLYGGQRLDDVDHIEATLRRCVDAAGATLLHIHLHHFEPSGGISGVAVLAESHISFHSWPEAHYAALDVFMCGKANPDKCVPVLRKAFNPKRIAVSELLRGQSRMTDEGERMTDGHAAVLD